MAKVGSLLWILVMMAVVQAIRAMVTLFKGEPLTPGEILAVVSPIATAVAVELYRRRKATHPFSMKLYEEPVGEYPRPKSKIYLKKGESNILVGVKTRSKAELNYFDIRFVELKWYSSQAFNAPTEYIEITHASAKWGATYEQVHKPNGVGGFRISTLHPSSSVPFRIGEYLWINLEIHASHPWSGYLSFESAIDSRAYARLPVQVLPDYDPAKAILNAPLGPPP